MRESSVVVFSGLLSSTWLQFPAISRAGTDAELYKNSLLRKKDGGKCETASSPVTESEQSSNQRSEQNCNCYTFVLNFTGREMCQSGYPPETANRLPLRAWLFEKLLIGEPL